jgi:hypothetical protein
MQLSPLITHHSLLITIFILLIIVAGPAIAQHGDTLLEASHDHAAGAQWEGSPAGVQYSDRNHQLAGIFILLVGLQLLLYSE